jgi:hypothetical protein
LAELGHSGELQQWIERAEAEVEEVFAESLPETDVPETETGFGEYTEKFD